MYSATPSEVFTDNTNQICNTPLFILITFIQCNKLMFMLSLPLLEASCFKML